MTSRSILKAPYILAFMEAGIKRSYPSRRTILSAGEPPRGLFLILQGSVSVMVEDEDGREMVLAYLKAGEFFGEMCLFPEQQVRTAIIRTRQPSLIVEVGFELFRELNQRQPEIMFALAGQLATRLRETSRRLRDMTFLDAADRIGRTLRELMSEPEARPGPEGITIRVSRSELSQLVGCSREMCGRVMKKLEQDGLMKVQGRQVFVPTASTLGAPHARRVKDLMKKPPGRRPKAAAGAEESP